MCGCATGRSAAPLSMRGAERASTTGTDTTTPTATPGTGASPAMTGRTDQELPAAAAGVRALGGAGAATQSATSVQPTVRTDVDALQRELARRFPGTVPIHEVGMPSGPSAGTPPKGVVLVVHGGGWFDVGAGRVRSMQGDAQRWQELGWATVNVDYAPGRRSLEDVTAFHDAIRSWQGPAIPIGAVGSSAGGHLSLLLAARRPELAFVASKAGATDLASLGGSRGADGERAKAARAFGADQLDRFSPTTVARSIRAELLLAGATTDPLVPASQMEALRAARPTGTTVLRLEPGSSPFTHAGISQAAAARYASAEAQLSSRHGLA